MTVRLSDFFAWILSASLMASVLVVLILAAKWLLRDKLKPRWGYLLWLLLILRLVLPWTPESSFSMYNIFHLFAERNHFAAANETAITPAVKPEIEGANPTQLTQSPQDALTTVQRDPTIKKPASPLQVASVVWLVGTVMFLGIMFRANLRFAKKLKGEKAITDPNIAALFESCKEEMSLRRRITLIQTNRVSSPTLFGLLKPKLLLPNMALTTLSDAQLRHVFLHELSHVRRNDIAMNGGMNILLALHWFNPFLWYAYHKMRVDQELACDALALSRVKPEESKEYALTIIKLLELFTKPIHLAGAVSILGNKKELKRRLIMIASPVKSSYKWSFVGVIVLLLLGGAALTNASSEEKHKEEATHATDAAIENLTTVWADALKSRDGKPRYDMMSANAKEKFVQEQIIRGGEDWNYNIGVSSPWVIDYRSRVDGMNAVITYVTLTSEPAYYKTVESVTFVKKKGKLVVDDYETLLEGELIPTNTNISKTDYEKMSNIIIAVNKGELPVSALKDAGPLLKREGRLIDLSISVREQYMKGPDYQLISRDEYTKMSHIISEVNAGNLPAEALKDADLLLERSPKMITPETRAKYLAFK
ncbi:M56 family metallopeptidase [Paenibacillus sp. JDR-2]|uniref:M56 family metallopeptidase n=1 Tax=Paenibacillus sp. (strain JDR-2) TaxID=324057 RepID=UPI00016648D1|nr:M56 family metallopeptidase [Paenibacillus sp. JDR-2]ACT04209.1 peptidase M56 BlaR1 [Paenibacillus sp. JDR-2]